MPDKKPERKGGFADSMDAFGGMVDDGIVKPPKALEDMTDDEVAEKEQSDLRDRIKDIKEGRNRDDYSRFSRTLSRFTRPTGTERVIDRNRRLNRGAKTPFNTNIDRYDERIYNTMRRGSRSMRAVEKEGKDKVGQPFSQMMNDVFGVFFKGEPELRDEKLVRDKNKEMRPYVEELMGNEETDTARMTTMFDEDLSAISALAFGKEIAKQLEKNPDPSDGQRQRDARNALNKARKAADDMEETMRAWGIERGDMNLVDPTQRLDMLENLNRERLKYLSDLIGKMKHVIGSARREKIERQEEEIYGLTRSGDIEHALPQELMKLRHPKLKYDFYRKMLENDLLSYELKTFDEVGKGPIVCCVDCSGSMSGKPLDEATAVAIAFVQVARKQNRDAHVIYFDHVIKAQFEFVGTSNRIDLNNFVDMASVGADGGTNFIPPLDLAREKIRDQRFKKADILFVTDGQGNMTDDYSDDFNRERKEKDLRVNSVFVSDMDYTEDNHAVQILEQFSDSVYSVKDFTEAARELAKKIR